MAGFNLPRQARRSADAIRAFKTQLLSFTWITRISQLLVSLVFPVIEAILINYATNATGKQVFVYYGLVAIIGVPHLIILFLIVLGEKPLSQYLFEYDELVEDIKDLELNQETELHNSTALNDAVYTATATLVQIEVLASNPPANVNDLFADILSPWIDLRSSIFFFRDGEALYNFAVYLYDDQTNLLKLAYRDNDSRLTRNDRSWGIGDGHVGQCFVQKRTIFLSLTDDNQHSDAVQTTQFKDTDIKYYRSMVATPLLKRNNEISGVLIVTSSGQNQFVKEIHTQIIDLLGLLVSESLNRIFPE